MWSLWTVWTELSAVFSLGGCTEGPPPADTRAIQLDAERRMVHATERVLLLQTAKEALEAGSPQQAAAAILLGMEIDAERFEPLVEALASSEDPAVLSLLADRLPADRVKAGNFAERALKATLERRFASGIPEGLRGVDQARGARVLQGVQSEYAAEPDEQAMEEATRRRFALLAATPSVRRAFPRWSGQAPGEGVLGIIGGAMAAGLPEPVAVSEGIEAALSALDRYTLAVWPASLTGWQEHHAGAAVGVGLELQDAPEGAGGAVVTLLDVNGPSWRAGVHVGDTVTAVDGAQGSSSELMARLHGEAGTTAKLSLDRQGKRLEIDVPREVIPEETVRGWKRAAAGSGWELSPAPGITYLRIESFRPHTDEQFDALVPDEPGVVVLDLRGNGGGDVMAAVNVADRFVEDGVLVTLAGRTIPPPRAGEAGELPWNVAIPGHGLEGVGVVVLVDRHTASAAEIVAGALRERAGAVLVGERTFGKGLAQALRVDEALTVGWQVTNGIWTLPSGAAFEPLGSGERGLLPDTEVILSPAERLQASVLQRKRELPEVHPDGTPVPDLGTVVRRELPRLSADPQLASALEAARALSAAAP